MTTTQINLRIDKQLKSNVDAILNSFGLNIADACRIFLNKVKLENGIPFDLKIKDIPNAETRQAMFSDTRTPINSVEDLWEQYENN